MKSGPSSWLLKPENILDPENVSIYPPRSKSVHRPHRHRERFMLAWLPGTHNVSNSTNPPTRTANDGNMEFAILRWGH